MRLAVEGHSAWLGPHARARTSQRTPYTRPHSSALDADAVTAASRKVDISTNGRALTRPHTARTNARRAMHDSSDDEIEILTAPEHRARPSAALSDNGHMTASQQLLLLLSDDSADEGDDLPPPPFFRASSQQRPRDVRSTSPTRRVRLSFSRILARSKRVLTSDSDHATGLGSRASTSRLQKTPSSLRTTSGPACRPSPVPPSRAQTELYRSRGPSA